jgi:hypothetical protein
MLARTERVTLRKHHQPKKIAKTRMYLHSLQRHNKWTSRAKECKKSLLKQRFFGIALLRCPDLGA